MIKEVGVDSIEIQEDGSAIVYDRDNTAISLIGKPWAEDAEGKEVKTWYTTDGLTLIQHVEHRVPGIVYPVVADPVFIPAIIVIYAVKLHLPAVKLGVVCARNWHGCLNHINTVKKIPSRIQEFRNWVLRQ